MSTAIIHLGDCREVMRGLPAARFHTVITSPPYWGLRDYGLPPSVWDGDAACEHVWGPMERHAKANAVPGPGGCVKNTSFHESKGGLKEAGTFCELCGAWFGCFGLEPTPQLYCEHAVEIFREVRRVLRDDGTLWLNLGDSYNGTGRGGGTAAVPGTLVFRDKAQGGTDVRGLKPKDMVGIPWRVAFALQADGWYLRSDIIWHKPNPMPSSVTDRPTTSHEYLFLLTKSERYYYDIDAIREPITSSGGASFGKQNHDAAGTGAQSRKLAAPEERNHPLGRNKRSVWTIATESFDGAHFATYPTKLVEPCVKAGSSERGCCAECGAPWRRLTEQTTEFASGSGRPAAGKGRPEGDGQIRPGHDIRNGNTPRVITTGWQPSCACIDEVATGQSLGPDIAPSPVPCRVFDPFAGSGTTLGVANQLGRDAEGSELNPEYREIALGRIAVMTRPNTARVESKRDEFPLFAP